MRYRGVIFDLWETLVDWDADAGEQMLQAVAARTGADHEDFRTRWNDRGNGRYIGPIRDALRAFGVADEAIEDVCAIRLDYNRRSLVPRAGAVETLQELRRRGRRLGMISVCSEEVSRLWPETAFHGLFDAEVFSCDVGLSKPDPRIYRACLDELGIEPQEAVFVGDGANDELAGAERAGLRAVLICPAGREPIWPETREWRGARIAAIPEVLELV